MGTETHEVYSCDVVIVGAGAAGCIAALKASEMVERVIVIAKSPVGKGGATIVAEKFMQAPFGFADSRDNSEVHFVDTVKGGYYLSEQTLAKALAEDICDRVRDLESLGLKFEHDESGKISQWPAAGTTYPRGCRPKKGGLGIINTLYSEIKKKENIKILNDFMVLKCIKEENRIAGIIGFNRITGKIVAVESKATVLATGNNGVLWEMSDVPSDLTGDGLVIAYEAGCKLIDMEMQLFYPTVIVYPKHLFGIELPTEMLIRRADLKLVNINDEEFLPSEIPVRDKMSALMYKEIEAGRGTEHGGLFFNPRKSKYEAEEIRNKIIEAMPEKYAYLKRYGLDLAEDPVQVAPMAHYMLGGVSIDEFGKTCVAGLYAGGELAGNCHGANRLAGNALSDVLVFGYRAGYSAAAFAKENSQVRLTNNEILQASKEYSKQLERQGTVKVKDLITDLRETMSKYVGMVRSEKGLNVALQRISSLKDKAKEVAILPDQRWNLTYYNSLQLNIMLKVAEVVIKAALLRQETRGHHWRTDFPERDDDNWLKHTIIQKENDQMKCFTSSVDSRYLSL